MNQRNKNFYTASSLLMSDRNYKFYCIFCKSSNHKSWNCDVITDVKMRKQIATQQKLCFNCLNTNHQAKKCNSWFTCYKCHEKHNTALCEKDISEKPDYGVKNKFYRHNEYRW